MPKGEAILFINLSPFLPIDKKYPPSFNHLILSYSTLVHSSRLPMTGVWIAEHIEQSPDKQSRNLEQILLSADEPDWKVGAQAILDGWQGMVMSEQQPCSKKLQLVLLPRVLLQRLDLALFDISISNIDCRYIDTFEKYRYRYRYRHGHF